MPVVTIKNVSEETLRELKIKAARAGQSLQAYLHGLLEQQAWTPSLSDMMTRLNKTTTARVKTSDVLDAIEAGRQHR